MSSGGKSTHLPLLIGLGIVLICSIAAVVLSIVILTKVSDAGTTTTTTTTSQPGAATTTSPSATLPPPAVSNSDLYNAIANRMSRFINFNANPCDDFYQYACGNYNETSSAFGFLANSQSDMLVAAIKNVQDVSLFNTC